MGCQMATKILYQNNQWKVTTWGLERKDQNYEIEKKRLTERHGFDHSLYSWPLHMLTKDVSQAAFWDVWEMALVLHGSACPDPIDQDVLEDTRVYVKQLILAEQIEDLERAHQRKRGNLPTGIVTWRPSDPDVVGDALKKKGIVFNYCL